MGPQRMGQTEEWKQQLTQIGLREEERAGGGGGGPAATVPGVGSVDTALVEGQGDEDFPGEVYVMGEVVHIVREDVPIFGSTRKGTNSAAPPVDLRSAAPTAPTAPTGPTALASNGIAGGKAGAMANGLHSETGEDLEAGNRGSDLLGNGSEQQAQTMSSFRELGLAGSTPEEEVLEEAAAKPGLLERFGSLAGRPFASARHHARVIPRQELRDLVVSPSMFLDHLPWRLSHAFKEILQRGHA
eukprot:TRINITY_DN14309_c0_g1_i1.p1 TRINITY_DN14309_c0_g1~~TRINITY_DN14309_c0_g1_i1.p1  ORF type:complete len:262 (-),score=23.26 TRINITY_DN14309_c0_g1_i1:78-806(-)